MDGNEDKEGELGGASASGSAEAPLSLVGRRRVVDRLFGDGEKKKLARERSDPSGRLGLPNAHL